jgi:hypothetical protein
MIMAGDRLFRLKDLATVSLSAPVKPRGCSTGITACREHGNYQAVRGPHERYEAGDEQPDGRV